MADETVIWPIEVVQPEAKLYMRVHRSFTLEADFLPGAFRDHGGAMSTEWDKYSSPEEVRSRAKSPLDNGVIEMPVSGILAIAGLAVQHTPDVERRIRGHVDVTGQKTTEARLKLHRIAKWVLPLSPA